MTYTTVSLEPFFVIGIWVRTTNLNGQSQQDIGSLWHRFYQHQIISLIPNKAAEDVYCIYTNYESDDEGPYTTLLGCRVHSLDHVPDGLTGKRIPRAAYRCYVSKGKLPETVLATWAHIWQSPVKRAYSADFDVYGPGAFDASEAEVKTYLSIR